MKKLKWSKKDMDTVNKLIARYLGELRLDAWQVQTSFEDEEQEDGIVPGAEIKTDPTYMRAYIIFYIVTLERWKDIGLKTLKDTIKHELCHILTEPLTVCAINRYIEEREVLHEREKLTEHISKLI